MSQCAATDSGFLPNVYHRAISLDHFRSSDSRVQGLPPEDAVCLVGHASYQYVRQSSPLWDRLHTGVLTTGRLAAALGLYEQAALRRMQISKGIASHSLLLNVYKHLSQPPYVPDFNPHISEEAAAAHNACITSAFNEKKTACIQDSMQHSNAALPIEKKAEALSKNSKHEQPSLENDGDAVQQQQSIAKVSKSKARRMRKNQSKSSNSLREKVGVPSGITESEKLTKSRSLAQAGLDAVRCTWGKVQEASSLLDVLIEAFPESQIIEAGLFMLDISKLPSEWGFDKKDLPLLGASPDGIILHKNTDTNSTANINHFRDKNSINTVENSTLLEVVEIKNVCPFRLAHTHSHRPGGRRRYIFTDPGPKSRVEPRWMPQIQLHMHCVGAASGLMVSRSATRGMKVFRVQRDPEYLRLMLSIVRQLWEKHVALQIPPPKDAFTSMLEHQKLVQLSRALAANAELVFSCDDWVGRASVGNTLQRDCRLFLD